MKFYLKQSVLNAALERICWQFDEFDNLLVNFSGCKDSAEVMNLALLLRNRSSCAGAGPGMDADGRTRSRRTTTSPIASASSSVHICTTSMATLSRSDCRRSPARLKADAIRDVQGETLLGDEQEEANAASPKPLQMCRRLVRRVTLSRTVHRRTSPHRSIASNFSGQIKNQNRKLGPACSFKSSVISLIKSSATSASHRRPSSCHRRINRSAAKTRSS